MDLLSSKPYWKIKNGPIQSFSQISEDISCDVLIVGGGISGALIADALVSVGLDTIIIDKNDLANGSTCGSTALIQYENDMSMCELEKDFYLPAAQTIYGECYKAVQTLENLAKKIGHTSYRAKNTYYFASNEADAASFEKELQLRKEIGINVELLGQKDINQIFSFSRPAALYSKLAAEIDPYLFTYDLISYNRKHGLRVFDKTEMIEFKTSPAEISVSVSNNKIITSKYLIIATGYETSKLIPQDLYTLNSSFAIASQPIDDFSGWHEQALLWESARPYLYLRTHENRALIGGLDEDFYSPEKRDALVNSKALQLEKKFNELFPRIEFVRDLAWAGTFAESKDGLPYVGELPKYDNCFFCCGFGGNGIVYSLLAGDIIRARIMGERHELSEILSFNRDQMQARP